MVRSCAANVPPADNPGVVLGTILGTLGKSGRDKITIVASPAIADFGAWLEQLLAESIGKQGKGLTMCGYTEARNYGAATRCDMSNSAQSSLSHRRSVGCTGGVRPPSPTKEACGPAAPKPMSGMTQLLNVTWLLGRKPVPSRVFNQFS